MDKKQNLTSFQELTTTELNQITGGEWWEELLHETRTLGLVFYHSACITVST